MPHIIVEYSANLHIPGNLQHLFTSIHEALARLDVQIDDCKSRAFRCDEFRVGEGDRTRAFVHATLAVLDRRPPAFQREAGELLLEILQRSFATRDLDCDFTVEVRPMRTDGYFKARTPAGAG